MPVRTTAKYAPSTDTGRERGLGTRRLWEGNAKTPPPTEVSEAAGWRVEAGPARQPLSDVACLGCPVSQGAAGQG